MVLAVVGCTKYDEFATNDGGSVSTNDGTIRLEINTDALGFGQSEITTRAGRSLSIETPRELQLKNMKALVFEINPTTPNDLTTTRLRQVKDVVKDYIGGLEKYFVVLEPYDGPVLIMGVANATPEKYEELLGYQDGANYVPGYVKVDQDGIVIEGDYSYTEFLEDAVMPYNNYDSAGQPTIATDVLRNTADGWLPIYSLPFTLNKLDDATVTEWDRLNDLVVLFGYSRIDLTIGSGVTGIELKSMNAIGAPNLPPNPLTGATEGERIDTDPVYSSNNTPQITLPDGTILAAYPTGIDETNYKTRYIQGLYIQPNGAVESLPGVAAEFDPVYLVFETLHDGEPRFYKILLIYDDEEGNPTYELKNNIRYLVNVSKINTPGYTSYEDAYSGPPSNITYTIDVDDQSANVITNGQYYVGVESDEYNVDLITYDSNMANINQDYVVQTNVNNDITWTVDNLNQRATVTVPFSYLGGKFSGDLGADSLEVGQVTADMLLTKEIIALDEDKGVSWKYGGYFNDLGLPVPAGVGQEEMWKADFGNYYIYVTIPFSVSKTSLEIRIGELMRTVEFNLNKTIVTDYSNQSVVNKLVMGDELVSAPSSVANSYILNPVALDDNEYYIPVVERIRAYWGEYAGTKNLDVIPTADWTNNDTYSVDVSWTDGDINHFQTGANKVFAVEKAVSPSGQNAILVKFDGGENPALLHQNFVVNVSNKTTGQILWSWHMWVTDYNPYITTTGEVPSPAPSSATAVMGGNVQKYGGDIWTASGIYANSMIMDRNIGAMSSTQNSPSQKGSLYFQYGRKDPFPGTTGVMFDGSSMYLNGAYNHKLATATVDNFDPVVLNPTQMIPFQLPAGSPNLSWCTTIVSDQYIWQDYKSSSSNNAKSIFDPSPLGWMVATDNVWPNAAAVFPKVVMVGVALTAGNFTMPLEDGTEVLYYGDLQSIEPKSGKFNQKYNFLWSASAASSSTANGLKYGSVVATFIDFMDGNKVKPGYGSAFRGEGVPVRSIKEIL